MDSTNIENTSGVARIGVEGQGEDSGETVRPRSWGAFTPSESNYLSPLVTPARSAGAGSEEDKQVSATKDDDQDGLDVGKNKERAKVMRNLFQEYDQMEEEEKDSLNKVEKSAPHIRSIERMKNPVRMERGLAASEMTSIEISSDSASNDDKYEIMKKNKNIKRKRTALITSDKRKEGYDEILQQLQDANDRIEALTKERDILDLTNESIDSVGRKKRRNYPKIEDILEDYKMEPPHSLEAELLSHIAAIESVAAKSGHLQGPIQRTLYMSALHMQAGITEYVRRITKPRKHKDDDIVEKLENQIELMKKEMDTLRYTIADLKEEKWRNKFIEEENLVDGLYKTNEELEKRMFMIEENNKVLEKENNKLRETLRLQEEQKSLKQQQIRFYEDERNKKMQEEYPPLPYVDRGPGSSGMYSQSRRRRMREKYQQEESEDDSDLETSRRGGVDRDIEDQDGSPSRIPKNIREIRVMNKERKETYFQNTPIQDKNKDRNREFRNNYEHDNNNYSYNHKSYNNRNRNYNNRFYTDNNNYRNNNNNNSSRFRKIRDKPEVVSIHCGNEKCSYADAVRRAKEKIDIDKLGIKNINMRRAMNGGLIIKVTEGNNKSKADALAKAMREIFIQDEARIGRPIKKSDVRLTGMDEDTNEIDIANALVRMGGVNPEDIKIGKIIRTVYGRNEVWVACPTTLAERLQETGVKVGWTNLRVKRLLPRPIQCFRCLEYGHLKAVCRNSKDRSSLCYRCGDAGHKAINCNKSAECIICKEKGINYRHRMGGGSCHSRTGNVNFYRNNDVRNERNFNVDRNIKSRSRISEVERTVN